MADRIKYFTIFATMFLVMPIYTLFHELGHAIFALLFTDDNVDIVIGESEAKIGSLKLKRINICFHNLITYYGICCCGEIKKESNKKLKRILISLGGPLVSAIFAGIGLLMCYYTSGSFINRIFNGITWSALIQLFMTIIPMKYKSGSYNGMISDGKRIMNVLKGKA